MLSLASEHHISVDADRRARAVLDLLPDGILTLADHLWERACRAIADPIDLDTATVITAPVLAMPDLPEPVAPYWIGAEAIHVDLGDDDRDAFEYLLQTYGRHGAEAVSHAAQEWRLPVTPYRRRDTAMMPIPRSRLADSGTAFVKSLDDVLVLDLTALWAGPLCTALLSAHGAQVVKIEPACRTDGFRNQPALFAMLNEGKAILDLDLRSLAARAKFEALVRRADLVVTSFSRRVMDNLGYGGEALRRFNPAIRLLEITAYPFDCVERNWVAYGSGVHATGGFAFSQDGEPSPAPVAYPDPLTGLAAFSVALDLLCGRIGSWRAEVSLAEVVALLWQGRERDAVPG